MIDKTLNILGCSKKISQIIYEKNM